VVDRHGYVPGDIRARVIGVRTFFQEHRMEPAVISAFVTAAGYFPHFIIDVHQSTPTLLPEQDGPSPFEPELTDADALELIRIYRLPTADLGRWAI
jgi:hypothetical protein